MKPYPIDAKLIYSKEQTLATILASCILEKIGTLENLNKSVFNKLDDWEQFVYLYFWMDHKIDGYGFLLLFNLNLAKYFPFIIDFLKKIEDDKSHEVFEEALEIYKKNKQELDASIGKDPLYLFDKYKNLEKLSNAHNKTANSVFTKINKYLKENISTYFVDQEGIQIDLKHTGILKSYYKNGNIKHEYQVTKGVISGWYKTYSLQGKLISKVDYDSKVEGYNPMIRYFTNGKIAEQSNVIKDGHIIYEKFDINSNPLIIEKRKIDNRYDKISEIYWENGIIQSRTIYTPITNNLGEISSDIQCQYYNKKGKAITGEEFNKLVEIPISEKYFYLTLAVQEQYPHIAIAEEIDIIDKEPICINAHEVFLHKIEKIPLENHQCILYIDVEISKDGLIISNKINTQADKIQNLLWDLVKKSLDELKFIPARAYNTNVDYKGGIELVFI